MSNISVKQLASRFHGTHHISVIAMLLVPFPRYLNPDAQGGEIREGMCDFDTRWGGKVVV